MQMSWQELKRQSVRFLYNGGSSKDLFISLQKEKHNPINNIFFIINNSFAFRTGFGSKFLLGKKS